MQKKWVSQNVDALQMYRLSAECPFLNLCHLSLLVFRLCCRGAWTACKVVKFPQTALMILLVAAYVLIGSLE